MPGEVPKLKALLEPAPAREWWFQRLVTRALCDMTSYNVTGSWMPDPRKDPADFMEKIYANWVATKRYLSEEDRKRAVAIRVKLAIQPFTKGHSDEAARNVARLNFWVGKFLPDMAAINASHTRKAGLDAAFHPFWAERLESDLAAAWPKRAEVILTGKKGKMKLEGPTFPSFRRIETSTFSNEKVEYGPDSVAPPGAAVNRAIRKVLETRMAAETVTTDEIEAWLNKVQRGWQEASVPTLVKCKWGGAPAIDIEEISGEERFLLLMTFIAGI